MRLLFDEQLPEALVVALSDVFPHALHIRLLGKGGTSDLGVWELAREHGVSWSRKDEDFHRLSVLRGAPPKVVWLRVGNCATRDLVALLRHHAPDLAAFDAQRETTVLEVG